ncbi:MAG: hypothetical protein ACX931_07525 [Saccharospirillum sp.]
MTSIRDQTLTSEADLSHCEQEDLAHPEQIQSLGAILVLEIETLNPVRWSDNLPALFDTDLESLQKNIPLHEQFHNLNPI